MSAFDWYPKDNAVDALLDLAKEEHDRGKTIAEIATSMTEAFTYALRQTIEEHEGDST